MRRKDRQITDHGQILDIVRRCRVCRLALNNGDYPYIVPLNYGFEDTPEGLVLYFRSASRGTKLDLMAADPHAAFEMDCGTELISGSEPGECSMAYESVMGRGTLEMLEGEEKLRALQLLVDHYHPEGFDWNRAHIPYTVVFKLTAEELTAKCRPNPWKC